MEILTSVKWLYISFKSLVNDFVYSFGRAALLLLVEVQGGKLATVWFLAGVSDFSLLQIIQTRSGAHPSSWISAYWGFILWDMKLVTYIHLLLRLRMYGFVSPLYHIQGGSNMTGTDFCVNKRHMSRSCLNHPVLLQYTQGKLNHFYFTYQKIFCVCICIINPILIHF